jgi:hypothetical protein
MALFDFIKPLNIKAPEITYFDHLLGEFESFEASVAAEAQTPFEKPAAAAVPPRSVVTSPPTDEDTAQGEDAALAAAAAAARESVEAARRVLRAAKPMVEKLKEKRKDETLDWNDLYHMEMILADARPVGSLRGKVLSLRHDYRSVAGQVEYDEYLASKPKNLLDPPDPRNPPDANANYELLLRDDLKDLLGRLFKRYAFLPVRESRLKRLTIWASLLCGLFLIALIVIILSMDREPLNQSAEANPNAAHTARSDARANSDDEDADSAQSAAVQSKRRLVLPSIALFVVLVSGAMGGFLSALQRIQSSPTEGDSIYNLSMLYHGSYAVFVAPLTGAVFAALLYFMFAGHILEGRFFPKLYTPPAVTAAPTPSPGAPATEQTPVKPTSASAPAPTRTAVPTAPSPAPKVSTSPPTNAGTNTNAGNVNAGGTNVGSVNAGNTNGAGGMNANTVVKPAPASGAAANPAPSPVSSLRVKEFLYDSGPAGGEDYALLIIWCFIAGFAERFVPDSLNRLVSGNQSGGQAGT